MGALAIVVAITGLVLGGLVLRDVGRRRREAFVRSYAYPEGVLAKLVVRHPTLDPRGVQEVSQALRTYFLCHLRHPAAHLAMPSKVVDDLWHGFILDTAAYAAFCRRAFGHFFHHVPAAPGESRERRAQGLLRVWRCACHEASIDPARPARLPLLFGIDARLAVAGGFVYDMERLARGHKTVVGAAGAGCGGGCSGCGGGGCGGGA